MWSGGRHEQFAGDGRKDPGAVFRVDDRVDEERSEEAFEVGNHSCLEHFAGLGFIEVELPRAHPIGREGKAEIVTAGGVPDDKAPRLTMRSA